MDKGWGPGPKQIPVAGWANRLQAVKSAEPSAFRRALATTQLQAPSFRLTVPVGKPSGGEAFAELRTKVLRTRRLPYGAVAPGTRLPWLPGTNDLNVVVLPSGVTVTVSALESLGAKTPSPG